jgi:hypothetical protein
MKSCDVPVLVVGNKQDVEKLVSDEKINSIKDEWGCKYLGKIYIYFFFFVENLWGLLIYSINLHIHFN